MRRDTINDHKQTILADSDRRVFIAALKRPPAPTKALRDAFAAYDSLVFNEQNSAPAGPTEHSK